jgi:hypothetical protein
MTTLATPTPPSDPSPTHLWSLARRHARLEDRLLLTDTVDLLRHLPKGVRPHELARAYPRIANEIRRLWPETEPLLTYLMALMVDHRGNRKGFPVLIQEEIRALVQYVAQREDLPAVEGVQPPFDPACEA